MTELQLEDLGPENASQANRLTLKPGQAEFLQPEGYAAMEGLVTPDSTWAKVVRADDRVVAFVRANFDPEQPREEFRSILWRIHVDADAQGRGVGRFAVRALADEARSRGFDRVTVLWERGDDGPEHFFLHLGFTPVGEGEFGDVVGELRL